MPEETSYILRWLDEETEHPVIAELRAHPGRWAVIRNDAGHGDMEAARACNKHPDVEGSGDYLMGSGYRARWVGPMDFVARYYNPRLVGKD